MRRRRPPGPCSRGGLLAGACSSGARTRAPSRRGPPVAGFAYIAGRRRPRMSDLPGAAPARDGHLRPRSRWWYVFALLGSGILLYFALRYDDIQKARRCFWLGVISMAAYPGSILVVAALGAADMLPYTGA